MLYYAYLVKLKSGRYRAVEVVAETDKDYRDHLRSCAENGEEVIDSVAVYVTEEPKPVQVTYTQNLGTKDTDIEAIKTFRHYNK